MQYQQLQTGSVQTLGVRARSQARERGFTIVELLIVIVVIGILAAITIVAYNGVQGRASDTAVQSDLRNFASKVMEYQAINGAYPAGGSSASATKSIPIGMDNFRLSRSAYDTSVHNFYYCVGTVGGTTKFAIGGVSKSGNKFSYTSDQGLRTYTGSWDGNSVNCPGMLPGLSSGWTYSYAYDKDLQAWSAWAQ